MAEERDIVRDADRAITAAERRAREEEKRLLQEDAAELVGFLESSGKVIREPIAPAESEDAYTAKLGVALKEQMLRFATKGPR